MTSADTFVLSMRAYHAERAAVCDGEESGPRTIQREMYVAHNMLYALYDALSETPVERDDLERLQHAILSLLHVASQMWHEKHDRHALIGADIFSAAFTQLNTYLDR